MRFDIDDWSIVPGGPSIRPPFKSISLRGITDYELDEVAAVILAIPSTRLLHDRDPDWWHWRAQWTFDDAIIDVTMSTMDGPDGFIWGGCGLSGLAEPAHLRVFYGRVQAALPCAWLHNSDCDLHTAQSFSGLFGAG